MENRSCSKLSIIVTNIVEFRVIHCLIYTAEKHDKAELGRLLQLILGCAVNCDEKQGMAFSILNGDWPSRLLLTTIV